MFAKVLRSLAVLPLLLAASTAVASASADTTGTGSGMSITLPNSATLIARVAVPVSAQITCSPPDLSNYNIYGGPYFYSNGSVTVSQASGRTVNSATGFVNGQIVCDNTAHSYDISVLASAPFHNGAAAITGSASWTEQFYGCLNVYPYGCNYFTFQNSASAQGALSLSS
jgi:hypothetical protein